ncbi:DNA polymerase III subunit [Sediminicola luteus]|uniref:DNA polymerase III subunit delta n=1 Tax=Sediminicola luteus TaxID=319238 RepID=A0A2A4GF36_9FLAO|nr:DNA polymerase III subunit delta' [Sediminicola luteus]PCE66576.1 DNA polymerase III subunit delta' [Sediminicola luteus]
MAFEGILGQQHIKNHLVFSADAGRIAHAQLFVGPEGCGLLPMALAYAEYLLCKKAPQDAASQEACRQKCRTLSHPDLHFAYPVANGPKVKSHAVSDDYLSDWRDFVQATPYANLFDWYQAIGIEKKQGQIGVDEAQAIVKKLALKSYEGGYKILIIWMAEKMNTAAANKLLKLIEEPPKDTILLLLAQNEEQIIQTILSRCQTLHVPPIGEDAVVAALLQKGLDNDKATAIAHEAQGNFNKALDLMNQDSEELVFEKWFVHWVRSAFKAKGNKTAIHDIVKWAEEVAKTGREVQKNYLNYCLAIFRQALLINYNLQELAFMRIHVDGFDLAKFAPFVHENNIEDIVKELEDARYHIERNGNAKIVFTDLSIKLTRLLHRRAA